MSEATILEALFLIWAVAATLVALEFRKLRYHAVMVTSRMMEDEGFYRHMRERYEDYRQQHRNKL